MTQEMTMMPEDVCGAGDALDGLLRVAYQQGRVAVSWDELCYLCEDAAIAGLEDWDLHPERIRARVVDVSTRIAVVLALRYRQQSSMGRQRQDARGIPEHMYSVLGLVHVLGMVRGDAWAARQTA